MASCKFKSGFFSILIFLSGLWMILIITKISRVTHGTRTKAKTSIIDDCTEFKKTFFTWSWFLSLPSHLVDHIKALLKLKVKFNFKIVIRNQP